MNRLSGAAIWLVYGRHFSPDRGHWTEACFVVILIRNHLFQGKGIKAPGICMAEDPFRRSHQVMVHSFLGRSLLGIQHPISIQSAGAMDEHADVQSRTPAPDMYSQPSPTLDTHQAAFPESVQAHSDLRSSRNFLVAQSGRGYLHTSLNDHQSMSLPSAHQKSLLSSLTSHVGSKASLRGLP